MKYDHQIAGQLYYHIQLVVNNWLILEEYAIGISDTIVDQPLDELIQLRIFKNT